MRVLGIDPGTLHLGWGIVKAEANHIQHVAHGVIDLDPKRSLATRLTVIEAALDGIIEEYSPTAGSVESLFMHRDPQAAAKLGHARGVVLLSLARAGLEIFEYPPTRVKLTVTGRGHADKRQVAMMMRALLALNQPPRSDAADALAVAVTHLRRAPFDRLLESREAEIGSARAQSGRVRRSKARGRRALPGLVLAGKS
jgi:crossover junction endodeoxyribonuclease RuvC